jgi:ABC-type lipoprotein release transport system permease subunit
VTPLDPAAFAGTAAVLVGGEMAASFVPLRRALRMNPLAALRYE